MKNDAPTAWIYGSIVVGALLVFAGLLLSAVFDPGLRVLHGFQALIYVAVLVLTRKNSAWGFGAAVFIATVWNCLTMVVKTFVWQGLGQLLMLVQTGRMENPTQLIVVMAAIGHLILIIACLVAFLRLRPGIKLWGQFLGGGLIALAYFAAIIITTGPRD